MGKMLCIVLALFLPVFVTAQTGIMRMYTVAGGPNFGPLGDGGPATAAYIDNTEGIWMDNNCNLYVSDMAPNRRIRKINCNTGIICTIAGNGVSGYSGDGGPATNAQLYDPYGLFSDDVGNIYVADAGNHAVRRIDATSGIITTFAGGGSLLGDGGPATNAQIGQPRSVYGDKSGNIYISGDARIRKVNPSGIISTLVGTGVIGLSGDGGPATNAQISAAVAGMVMDASGNLYIADRANSRIRKILASTGIITTVAGSSDGYSGDGGPATNAQLSGPISIFLDNANNLLIGDNQNDVFRKVNLATGIITYVAGLDTGSTADGTPATSAKMHPEFIYIDLDGNIYFSNYSNTIHKITNYFPGLAAAGSICTKTNGIENLVKEVTAISIFPNPTTDELTIKTGKDYYHSFTITNSIGQLIMQQQITSDETKVNVQILLQGVYVISFKGDSWYEVKRFVKY